MFRNYKILKLFTNNTKLRKVKEKMFRNYKIQKLFFFFFFFFFMNGNTERAQCALSQVCIP